MNNCLILVVEDDTPVRNLIATTLKAHHYRFTTAGSGNTAITEAASRNPDIILLDLGLPDMDGISVIQRIRSWSSVPIIVISARSEDRDKILALDAGADDYLTKPFSVEELLARLRATQRRMASFQQRPAEDAVYRNGDLVIDHAAGNVALAGVPLKLTPTEYRLLCILAQNTGRVLTHTYLTDKIWGKSLESDNASLRVHMATLRKKIQPSADKPQLIQTHIGIGYQMQKTE